MKYKLWLYGQWVSAGPELEIRNKYTQEVFAILPTVQQEEMEAAIAAARRAAGEMAGLPAYWHMEEMTHIQLVAIRKS